MPKSVDIAFSGQLADLGDLDARIRAQAEAGYRTAVVRSGAPVASRDGIPPAVMDCVAAGWAQSVDQRATPIAAGLLVLALPDAASAIVPALVQVDAETVVLPIDDATVERWRRSPAQRADAVAAVTGRFGRNAWWMPTSRGLRARLASLMPDLRMHGTEWRPVLDPEPWTGPRPPRGDAPRLLFATDGRRAPSADLRSAVARFAAAEAFAVRGLVHDGEASGWDGIPANRLALFRPAASEAPRFFRAGDFYLVDPEGAGDEPDLALLQAMASGVVPVIPPSVALDLPEDAVVRAPAASAVETLRALWSSPGLLDRKADRARRFALARSGAEPYLAQLNDFVGPSAGAVRGPRKRARRPVPRPSAPTVLMVGSNGVGMGHVTRLLAIARRLPASIRPVFATFAHALDAVGSAGYRCEYLPSPSYAEVDLETWNLYLAAEIGALIRLYGPFALVYDGNSLPPGLLAALRRHPDCRLVWVRGGMWFAHRAVSELAGQKHCDLLIAPGELARSFDDGITVTHAPELEQALDTVEVPPISLVEPSDLLPAEAARRDLALGGGPAVLIQLGAGNVTNVVGLVDEIVGQLSRMPGLQIVIAEWLIAERPVDLWPQARRLRLFPVGRYFAAFDLSIGAAGYNGFHEVIRAGLPTIFLPARHETGDLQVKRAAYAAQEGLGYHLSEADFDKLPELVTQMLDPAVNASIRRRCRAAMAENGAIAAAERIARLAPGATMASDAAAAAGWR